MLEQARKGRPEQRIRHEHDGDDRQRPAHAAPRGLQQRHDQHRAHHHVQRQRVAHPEHQVVKDPRDVQHRRCHGHRQRPVKPGHAAGVPQARRLRLAQQCLAVRKHQEDQAQHEGQVHATVGDLLQQPEAGRVEVEQRQRDQQPAHQRGGPQPQGPEAHLRVELLLQFLELLVVRQGGGGHGDLEKANGRPWDRPWSHARKGLTSAGRLPGRSALPPGGRGCPRPAPRFPW